MIIDYVLAVQKLITLKRSSTIMQASTIPLNKIENSPTAGTNEFKCKAVCSGFFSRRLDIDNDVVIWRLLLLFHPQTCCKSIS